METVTEHCQLPLRAPQGVLGSAHRTAVLHGELEHSQPEHHRYAHGGKELLQLHPGPWEGPVSPHKPSLRNGVQRAPLTFCLDERFCNLSFGCLNSFVVICPGSQKTGPLITAWLLCKAGRVRRRSPFYAFDKLETKFQRTKLMLICLSSPT